MSSVLYTCLLPLPRAPFSLLLLDRPIDEAMKRGEFGAERYEKEEFQVRHTAVRHSQSGER